MLYSIELILQDKSPNDTDTDTDITHHNAIVLDIIIQPSFPNSNK